MARRTTGTPPPYCLHRQSGRAYLRLGGRQFRHLALLDQRKVVDVGADDVDLLVEHVGGGVLAADVLACHRHLPQP